MDLERSDGQERPMIPGGGFVILVQVRDDSDLVIVDTKWKGNTSFILKVISIRFAYEPMWETKERETRMIP